MSAKHLVDCYVTTKGIDFAQITFITLHNIPHKLQLKLCDDDEKKNNGNELHDEKSTNQPSIHSTLLKTCNESTKDSKYPFKQTVFFWSYTFHELTPNRQYILSISINNQNNHFEQIHSAKLDTLKKPKGKLLFTFGILADSHINLNYTNKMAYGKRLYHAANDLCSKYIDVISNQHKAHFIIFPGDICDYGTKQELKMAHKLLLQNKAKIKCYPIIGNHESYSSGSARLFYKTFNLSNNGFYSFDRDNYHFIMISAPDQQDLDTGTIQYNWLCNELEKNKDKICFIFTHFSFVLHGCTDGWKNDGLQIFDNHKNLLKLFGKYNKSLRVIFAGHKNVPSVVVKGGIYHLLCPQLIQSPCSYDIVDVYEHGIVRKTVEIDEKCLVYQSRVNCGEADWNERFGTDKDRNFSLHF